MAIGTARPGVCVVGSGEFGSAYPRIAECGVDVMAVVHALEHVQPGPLLHEYDAIVVGCAAVELERPTFQAQALRLARTVPLIAVVPLAEAPATAARLGFRGLVAREVSPEAFTRTVAAVAAGEVAFPRGALRSLFQLLAVLPLSNPDAGRSELAPLTPRQRQIVELIAQGATDREIAHRLNISESTAHKHVQHALRRSRTRTRSQLAAFAREQHWIAEPTVPVPESAYLTKHYSVLPASHAPA